MSSCAEELGLLLERDRRGDGAWRRDRARDLVRDYTGVVLKAKFVGAAGTNHWPGSRVGSAGRQGQVRAPAQFRLMTRPGLRLAQRKAETGASSTIFQHRSRGTDASSPQQQHPLMFVPRAVPLTALAEHFYGLCNGEINWLVRRTRFGSAAGFLTIFGNHRG